MIRPAKCGNASTPDCSRPGNIAERSCEYATAISMLLGTKSSIARRSLSGQRSPGQPSSGQGLPERADGLITNNPSDKYRCVTCSTATSIVLRPISRFAVRPPPSGCLVRRKTDIEDQIFVKCHVAVSPDLRNSIDVFDADGRESAVNHITAQATNPQHAAAVLPSIKIKVERRIWSTITRHGG